MHSIGHRVDAVEPICLASKAHPLNLMKVEATLSHSSSPCAPHHAETHLCISLPYSISLIANIARKRPELHRDKTIWSSSSLACLVKEPMPTHLDLHFCNERHQLISLCTQERVKCAGFVHSKNIQQNINHHTHSICSLMTSKASPEP